jgi:hypothetical protein
MDKAHRLRQSCRLAGTALMAAVICVTTACQSHDSTEPLPPPAPTGPFVISPSAAFAGSTVMIHGAEFRTRGTGAVLGIGDTLTSLARVDDTTMSVHLPATLGGVVTPVLKLDGYQFPLASITVFGFAAMHSFEESTHEATVWPRTGRAVVMGFSDETSGLSFFDLDATTVTTFPQVHYYLHGPGATYQDSVFLFQSGGDSIESWRVLPVPERIATYVGIGNGIDWEAMQLSPNQWLTADKYDIATPTGLVQTFEPQGALMSPRRDRSTLRALGASGPGFGDRLPGIPVFDVPSGRVAYTVPLKVAIDADFSPDGELLAMVGGAFYINDMKRVMLFRASTGEVLGDTTLDRTVYSVAIDPSRPLLYVGTITGNRPTIVVLDRSTFRSVGEMEAPAYTSAVAYPGVIALNSQNGLYFFWYGNGDPSPAWRFSLPPP